MAIRERITIKSISDEAQMDDDQENMDRMVELNSESGHGSWVSAMNIFHEDLNIVNKECTENDRIHSKMNQADGGGSVLMLIDAVEKSESSQENESWSDMLRNTGSVFSFASDVEPSTDSREVMRTNASPTTKSSCLSPPTPKYPRRVCQLKGSIPLHPRINQAYEELKNKRENQPYGPNGKKKSLQKWPISNCINHRRWNDFCIGGVIARFQEINADQSAIAFLKSFTSGDFVNRVPVHSSIPPTMNSTMPSLQPACRESYVSKAVLNKNCIEKNTAYKPQKKSGKPFPVLSKEESLGRTEFAATARIAIAIARKRAEILHLRAVKNFDRNAGAHARSGSRRRKRKDSACQGKKESSKDVYELFDDKTIPEIDIENASRLEFANWFELQHLIDELGQHHPLVGKAWMKLAQSHHEKRDIERGEKALAMAWNVLRSCSREGFITKEKLAEYGDAFVEIIQDFRAAPGVIGHKEEFEEANQSPKVDRKPTNAGEKSSTGFAQKKHSGLEKAKTDIKRKCTSLKEGLFGENISANQNSQTTVDSRDPTKEQQQQHDIGTKCFKMWISEDQHDDTNRQGLCTYECSNNSVDANLGPSINGVLIVEKTSNDNSNLYIRSDSNGCKVEEASQNAERLTQAFRSIEESDEFGYKSGDNLEEQLVFLEGSFH